MTVYFKKLGWFLVSMCPVCIFVILQAGCTVFAMLVLTVMEMILGTPGEELMYGIQDRVMDNILLITIVSQVLTAMIAGAWYYFVWGREGKDGLRKKITGKQLLLIPILGLVMQFLISGILTIIDLLVPSALESYKKLLETAGFTEITLLMLLTTVVLAPLAEELLCRGLVLRLAGKVSKRFWIVNIIQAFAFGVMHGNIVQGSYAFLLGLVLGFVYNRFGNIWICMLLHGALNLSSILVSPAFSVLPEKYLLMVLLLILILCLVIFGLILRALSAAEEQINCSEAGGML